MGVRTEPQQPVGAAGHRPPVAAQQELTAARPTGPALTGEQLVALQRTAGNRVVRALLHTTAPAIQRKEWAQRPSVGWVGIPEVKMEDGSTFEGHLYDGGVAPAQATRAAAIAEIAKTSAEINDIPAPAGFLAAKTLRSLGVARSGVRAPLGANRGKNNQYDAAIDPFQIRITGSYGNDPPLNMYYQYAQSSYGYVVKIEQGGNTYEMDTERGQYSPNRGPNLAPPDPNRPAPRDLSLKKRHGDAVDAGTALTDPLFKKYASGHEEGDEAVHETATGGVTDTDLGLAAGDNDERKRGLELRSRRLDAATKIAGEGARWQAVRAHARNGHLKTTSKFWCMQNAVDTSADPDVHYVTFKTLWGSWKDVFQYQFNIPDGRVAAELRASDFGGQRQAARASAMGLDDYQCR